MNLIQTAMGGICEARKSLHGLGNQPQPGDVQRILQKVAQMRICVHGFKV